MKRAVPKSRLTYHNKDLSGASPISSPVKSASRNVVFCPALTLDSVPIFPPVGPKRAEPRDPTGTRTPSKIIVTRIEEEYDALAISPDRCFHERSLVFTDLALKADRLMEAK